jgi:hypothetical protein
MMTKRNIKVIITAAELRKWQGKRSQVDCAALLKTPWRTYVGWLRGERRIPGVVAAFIDADKSI